ncbi:MAG: hypothetical protein IT462_10000 [Planctomycetes bacterium]|nr:hypothetical protein [Planctomycetota bacterium]
MTIRLDKFVVIALVAAAFCAALSAEPVLSGRPFLDDVRQNVLGQARNVDENLDPPKRPHGSETDRFREAGIGEFSVQGAFFSHTRTYNVTDIRGFDHPWSGKLLPSADYFGLGGVCIVDYRVSADWRITVTHRADFAYGFLNSPRHESHSLRQLPFSRNYRGAYDQQKLSFNLGVEIAARWRYMWIVHDFDALMAFRRIKIRAYDTDYEDDQLGRLDFIKDRKRTDWDHIFLLGAGVGVGFEWFFIDEGARFVTVLTWRPWTYVSFRDASGFTNGFEFNMRSAPFELTNQIGLYFDFTFQAFLPVDHEFNQIYQMQFSIGLRFK